MGSSWCINLISLSVIEEKCALSMLLFFNLLDSLTHSITSKQMFSPSLSQSSHKTRKSEPFDSDAKKFGIFSLAVVSDGKAKKCSQNVKSLKWKMQISNCKKLNTFLFSLAEEEFSRVNFVPVVELGQEIDAEDVATHGGHLKLGLLSLNKFLDFFKKHSFSLF